MEQAVEAKMLFWRIAMDLVPTQRSQESSKYYQIQHNDKKLKFKWGASASQSNQKLLWTQGK